MDEKQSKKTNHNISDIKLENTPTIENLLTAAYDNLQGMIDSIKDTASTFENSITREEKIKIELSNKFKKFVEDIENKEAEAWPPPDLQDSVTSVIIAIYNGTSDIFKLSYSNWDATTEPEGEYDVSPWSSKSYIMDSAPPELGESGVKTYFTYTAVEKSFDILTQVKIENPIPIFPFPGFDTPEWELKIRSFGDAQPTYRTYIAQRLSEHPYSYRVVIILD